MTTTTRNEAAERLRRMLGSSCLHRYQQATRYDELPPFSWREAGEIALGALVLSAAFVVIFVYGAAMAVGQ